ncbi:MAG: DUF1304 domain-containing protein [Capnocytophaga sp.]|nr:DUF1304 domain-containing protein [Capnocytophaga sp.]
MESIATIATVVVAVEHLYILWIEMFAWETTGKKVFGGSLPDELFAKTKRLAANQGLYNGFLAAGLLWSLLIGEVEWSLAIRMFFLGCVIIAAVYGAATASKSILVKQGLPAIIAMALTLWVVMS